MASVKRQLFMYPGALLRLAKDIAFPPRCPSCKQYVAADGNFCADCFNALRMISAPMCQLCGIPFVVAIETETRCPECLETAPEFDTARAVMVYDSVSAPLVSSLKFNDQWAGIHRHAHMMAAAGSQMLAEADLLIPVPLHWRRLVKRKFNQSALLAYGVSRVSGVPCLPDLLKRVRSTKPQMSLDRKSRAANVKKAFAVSARTGRQLEGLVVVLVDDVVTTGATANACARTLKKAGAKQVHVLSLARTVKE